MYNQGRYTPKNGAYILDFFSLFLAVLSLVAIIIVYAKYDIAVIALGNHLTVSIVYILWTVFYTTIFPIV